MIQPKTYYEVICDNCGERLALDDTSAWETQEDAETVLTYCDWQMREDGRCYCRECLDSMELDYEDEEE